MILKSPHHPKLPQSRDADIDFHPQANIVVGRNGQGKTNLLEAIYFLATTKSFRTTRIASVFRFDAPSVFVSGVRASATGRADAVRRPRDAAKRRRRVLMINGEKVTLPAYLHALSVFAYSSARLEIIRGTPEERRRFLDRGIASIDPAYLEQLSRYTRVLQAAQRAPGRDRARSASRGVARRLGQRADRSPRRRCIARAAAYAARPRRGASSEIVADARLSRRRTSSCATGRARTDDLARIRRDELRARMSLVGPQRDVLEFLVDGRPAAEVLSGGEQKMIVLFLKFAKLELFRRRHDEAPLFLLDDVDAELDLEILQQLLSKLPVSTQVFATSAKEAFLAALRGRPAPPPNH